MVADRQRKTASTSTHVFVRIFKARVGVDGTIPSHRANRFHISDFTWFYNTC
jgi:hypothetical protein